MRSRNNGILSSALASGIDLELTYRALGDGPLVGGYALDSADRETTAMGRDIAFLLSRD